MAVAPVCNRCSKPHFNFTPCADAAAEIDRQEARKPEFKQPLASVMHSVPEGLKTASGWGANDGWAGDWDGPKAA